MKSDRSIPVADHLWAIFERMAAEMGSDPGALVNEAMHAFAVQHGYSPGAEARPAARDAAPGARAAPDRRAVAARVLETAARLERSLQAQRPAPAAAAPRPAPAAGARLVLVRSDGVELPVTKDRFVIGRGRHCDLVVDSTKISREHAAVTRDDLGWSIEDLGSSNGTWYRRERIARRRIQDGDEYFICSERIRCVLR